MAVHDDEGHADGRGHGEEDVDPPECPGEVDEPVSPLFAGKDHHVDDGCFRKIVSIDFSGILGEKRISPSPKLRV